MEKKQFTMGRSTTSEVADIVDKLCREEGGKVLAVLTRILGPSSLHLAEDVVQEAIEAALLNWRRQGIPDNPQAWLFTVAKNKALNVIRREKYQNERLRSRPLLQSEWSHQFALDQLWEEENIADDQLRMMFTCCHPSLSTRSQIILILRFLCGLKVSEITQAFLANESAISKQLLRAKASIRDSSIPFEIPARGRLQARLDVVLKALFLLFNEGYASARADRHIRVNLCNEAISLAGFLAQHPVGNKPATHSLLALMWFNMSRFPARIGDDGELILLKDHDRSLWDREMIRLGLQHFGRAAVDGQTSTYHLQAAISACHCLAVQYKDTNWDLILKLYDQLLRFENTPVVKLNRLVVWAQVHDIQSAQEALEDLLKEPALQKYYLSYAVAGSFHEELGEWQSAAGNFERALTLAKNPVLQDFLQKKLVKLHAEKSGS